MLGELPVVILDTVRIVVVIGDERCPLKYAGAGAAAETVSMETLAHRLQDTVRDLLSTSGTHCQGILRGERERNSTVMNDFFLPYEGFWQLSDDLWLSLVVLFM